MTLILLAVLKQKYMCMFILCQVKDHVITPIILTIFLTSFFHSLQGKQLLWLPVCFLAYQTSSEKEVLPLFWKRRDQKNSFDRVQICHPWIVWWLRFGVLHPSQHYLNHSKTMEGSVPWDDVLSWAEFCLQQDSNPGSIMNCIPPPVCFIVLGINVNPCGSICVISQRKGEEK